MPHILIHPHSFDYVCEIDPVKDFSGRIVTHTPPNPMGLPLDKYGTGPFCSFAIPSNYTDSGVYIITLDRTPHCWIPSDEKKSDCRCDEVVVCEEPLDAFLVDVLPSPPFNIPLPKQVFRVYVGKCMNLARQFNDGYGRITIGKCCVKGQQTNCRINKLILCECSRGNKVRLWFYPVPPPENATIKKTLLKSRLPWPWN